MHFSFDTGLFNCHFKIKWEKLSSHGMLFIVLESLIIYSIVAYRYDDINWPISWTETVNACLEVTSLSFSNNKQAAGSKIQFNQIPSLSVHLILLMLSSCFFPLVSVSVLITVFIRVLKSLWGNVTSAHCCLWGRQFTVNAEVVQFCSNICAPVEN